tara:strand:- start:4 stop:351 length:348 start_codon:yes stop_codon:yes gene_type:complete
MKFEANIPSYLRTGQGVFPVKAKGTPKAEKETNFFKLMEKGVNMPVSNDIKGTESALLGSPGMNEPQDTENFLEKMQRKAPELKQKPVTPMVAQQNIQEPKQMEAETEDADIFIS